MTVDVIQAAQRKVKEKILALELVKVIAPYLAGSLTREEVADKIHQMSKNLRSTTT